jgi:hypothetical protein
MDPNIGLDYGLFCVPFDLAVLASQYANHSRLRYADLATWDGSPIPVPGTCPAVSGFTICGGACGGCNGSERCRGRAPMHPYGFCAAPSGLPGLCHADGSKKCSAGDSCFIFNVDPPGQALADFYGTCLPDPECQSLAQSLPGAGGKCVP